MKPTENLAWRKSTRTGSNGGTCVEAAPLDQRIAVRDSKDPDGPQLCVSSAAWRTFAATIRNS